MSSNIAARICSAVLFRKTHAEAKKWVSDYMSKFYNDELPLEDFVLSKKLAKLEYDNPQPHVKVREQIIKPDGESMAPCLGERVEFVLIGDSKVKNASVTERALNMICATKARPVIDFGHYAKLIGNAMSEILVLAYGSEEASVLLNPETYARKRKVKAAPDNVLGFFGVEKRTKSRAKK